MVIGDFVKLFLFLHIGGAIIAFGPTFALPLMGAMSGKEPQHANFAARATGVISTRRIIPFALSMAVTGAPHLGDRPRSDFDHQPLAGRGHRHLRHRHRLRADGPGPGGPEDRRADIEAA